MSHLELFDPKNLSDLKGDALKELDKESENFEDNTSLDEIIPTRFSIVQTSSNVLVESHKDFIPEAKAGNFASSMTKEVICGKKGLVFIPCAKSVVYLTFSKEKKIKNYYGTDATAYNSAVVEDYKHLDKDGDEIKKSYEYCVLYYSELSKRFETALISLSATQSNKAKKFNTILHSFKSDKTGNTYPYYSRIFKITTMFESNAKGNWHGVVIDNIGFTSNLPDYETIFEKAKDVAKDYKSGKISVDEVDEEVSEENII